MDSKKEWKFFSQKLETMWNVYLNFNEQLDSEFSKTWQAFCEDKNEQQYKDYLHEIEFPYRNILNGSMLTSFCSLTEHVIANITKTHVPDYENKLRKKKRNWLIKNIKLLNEQKFNIDQNSEDIEFFCHYIEIRNCIVHAGGNISNSKRTQLKNAIEAIREYATVGNYNMIEIKDNFLLLGTNLISDVVIRSEAIIENILEKTWLHCQAKK